MLEQLRDETQVTLAVLVGLIHELHLQGLVDLDRLAKLAVVQLTRVTAEAGARPEACGQLSLCFVPTGDEQDRLACNGDLVCSDHPLQLVEGGGVRNATSDAGC